MPEEGDPGGKGHKGTQGPPGDVGDIGDTGRKGPRGHTGATGPGVTSKELWGAIGVVMIFVLFALGGLAWAIQNNTTHTINHTDAQDDSFEYQRCLSRNSLRVQILNYIQEDTTAIRLANTPVAKATNVEKVEKDAAVLAISLANERNNAAEKNIKFETCVKP